MPEKEDRYEEIEIDLLELLYVLWSKRVLIIVVTLIVAILSYVTAAYIITPKYTASVSIYVSNSNRGFVGEEDYISQSNLTTSQRLVNTYVNILQSRSVLGKIIDYSGVDMDTEELKKMMSAKAIDNTEIFSVSIEDTDPERSARIANTVARVAPDEIAEIIDGSSTKIIDNAQIPEKPSRPNKLKFTAIGAMLGVLIACAYVIIQRLLDVRIKGEEDLKKFFDFPVLGVIPDFDAPHGSSYASSYGYGKR